MIADAFTQIVWMDTQMFGIAIGRSEDHYVVIAVYYPSGNDVKKYTNNVKKSLQVWTKEDLLLIINKLTREVIKFKEKYLECS